MNMNDVLIPVQQLITKLQNRIEDLEQVEKDLTREVERQVIFIDKAFAAHPSLDLDIKSVIQT